MRKPYSESGDVLNRRGFIKGAATGLAGAALTFGLPADALAKDSGEITLDAILLSYVAPPLGTTSSSLWTPHLNYSTTLSLRSLVNPALSLRPAISATQERINSRAQVRQSASTKVDDAIALFSRPRENENFSIGTAHPGIEENVLFYGLIRPRLAIKGGSRKVNFRLIDAEGTFALGAADIFEAFSADTASSMLDQYVKDKAALVGPRFASIHVTTGGPLVLEQRAERNGPRDISSAVLARVVEQSGFSGEAYNEAFAVGAGLEITYYSANESNGKLLRFESDLNRTSPGINRILWDRVFKTFVITDEA
jgi:hypothetical protein